MTELAEELARRGWTVRVICCQPVLQLGDKNPTVPRRMQYQGIEIIRVPVLGSHASLVNRAILNVTFMLMSLVHGIRAARRADVLLACTNPPLIPCVAALIGKLTRRPCVQIVYDLYPETVGALGKLSEKSLVYRLWKFLSTWSLKAADANVVIGRDMAERVQARLKGRPHGTIELIPNWSNERTVVPVPKAENAFRQATCSDDVRVVQYSGRAGSTHNLEVLIEAAALLAGEPYLFQIIGDGAKSAAIQALVRERNLRNIQFLPYQPLSSLGAVLSAADVGVVCLHPMFAGLSVPSKTYGIMASGTPILGLLDRQSEIGQTIEENQCGVVVQEATAEAVAGAIRAMCANPETMARLGANARNAFIRHYTLRGAGEKYDQLLGEVISRRT